MMTPEERQARRHARSAERKNEAKAAELAEAKAAAPLFAEQIQPPAVHSAANEYWHWRRNRADAGVKEGYWHGAKMMGALQVRMLIEPFARKHVGDAFEKLRAYCFHTYPSQEYWYGFWKDVLTGKQIVFAYRKVENWTKEMGGPCVVPDGVYQHATMTREEFYEMFPYKDEVPLESGIDLDPLKIEFKPQRLETKQ